MGALLDLVTLGTESKYLFNDEHTILNRPPKCQKTSQELVELSFNRKDDLELATISRRGDLVGECFYHLTLPTIPEDIYDIIENITLIYAGQEWETYNGQVLRILSTFDKKAKYTCKKNHDDTYTIVFPLRLCFSQDLHSNIPLIRSSYSELKVSIKLTKDIREQLRSQSLYVTYIFLDTNERFILGRDHEIHQSIWIKSCHKTSIKVDSVNSDEAEPIDVKIPLSLRGQIRDLIVYIKQKSTNLLTDIDIVYEEPLINMRFVVTTTLSDKSNVKEYTRQSYNAIMARYVIPNHIYNTSVVSDPIYFMPFDHTPIDKNSTASINMNELNTTTLIMKLLPGEYDIYIMSRRFNVLVSRNGALGLIFG